MHVHKQELDLDLPSSDQAGGGNPVRGPSPVEWASLLLSAASRRKWIALVAFLFGMAALFGYYKVRSPLYRVETKLLAQRPLSSMGQRSDVDPTRAARDLV
jgi:uncharacterized protein involved in exopolysaccharide biosynthesis